MPDHEARETIADAEALFSKLKKWIKSEYDRRGKSLGRRETRERGFP